jgi:hypothetical protein
MKIKFFNIDWDTDGVRPKSCGLPSEITIDVPSDCNVEYEGADILSDKFGFCVFGFEFERGSMDS